MKATFKQIFTDERIRSTLLFTLLYLFLFRIGLNILMPGITGEAIYNEGETGIIGVVPFQDLSLYSILTIGIWPYYTASILAPVLMAIFFGKVDSEGKRKRTNRRLIILLTLGIAFLQAPGYASLVITYFISNASLSGIIFWSLSIILVSGALICMWLADKITEKGLVDGRILLVVMDMILLLPGAFMEEFYYRLDAGKLGIFGFEIIFWVLIIIGIVALMQATREVPVKFKSGSGTDNEAADGSVLIPFNLIDDYSLAAASFFAITPGFFLSFFASEDLGHHPWLNAILNPDSVIALIFSFLMVVIITYLYVAILVKPKIYEKALDQQGLYVSGVAEGEETRRFFRKTIRRLTLPLSLCLGLIAILPFLSFYLFRQSGSFLPYFGGLSFFLLVSVFLDFYSRLNNAVDETDEEDPLILGRTTSDDLVSDPKVVFLLEVWDEEEEE